MVARVEKTDQGYVIPVTDEMVQEMRLSEGTSVEITALSEPDVQSRERVRYASVEQALRAFEETLPRHENTYRELAK